MPNLERARIWKGFSGNPTPELEERIISTYIAAGRLIGKTV